MPFSHSSTVQAEAIASMVTTGRPGRRRPGTSAPNTATHSAETMASATQASSPKRRIQYKVAPWKASP